MTDKLPTPQRTSADLTEIIRIMRYRRAAGSPSLFAFLREIIAPVFGEVFDASGNYALRIGDKPTTAFMAHYDSVETKSGNTILAIDSNGFLMLSSRDTQSACLGADDGAGLWLMLEMIKAKIPGLYLLFADEETGCQGSAAFAHESGYMLAGITKAVSLDRHNADGPQVITGMCGSATASPAFASALAARLGMGFCPSSKGLMTDSLMFDGVADIREVTNISVGYALHHTHKERLDTRFLIALRDKMLAVDWDTLPVERDPFYEPAPMRRAPRGAVAEVYNLVRDNPDAIAQILVELGYDAYDLWDEINRYEDRKWRSER
jgi:hypothetical protein